MYKRPSSRKKRSKVAKLNLSPILDAVFIFIFFLLMSVTFYKVNEIGSDVPIASDEPPKNNEKPLALTLKITDEKIVVFQGVPSSLVRTFEKNPEGKFDFEAIHNYAIEVKKAYVKENTLILEPDIDISYELIVEVMDAFRLLRNTDEPIYIKGKDGVDEKVKALFDNILFGNLLS